MKGLYHILYQPVCCYLQPYVFFKVVHKEITFIRKRCSSEHNEQPSQYKHG